MSQSLLSQKSFKKSKKNKEAGNFTKEIDEARESTKTEAKKAQAEDLPPAPVIQKQKEVIACVICGNTADPGNDNKLDCQHFVHSDCFKK